MERKIRTTRPKAEFFLAWERHRSELPANLLRQLDETGRVLRAQEWPEPDAATIRAKAGQIKGGRRSGKTPEAAAALQALKAVAESAELLQAAQVQLTFEALANFVSIREASEVSGADTRTIRRWVEEAGHDDSSSETH